MISAYGRAQPLALSPMRASGLPLTKTFDEQALPLPMSAAGLPLMKTLDAHRAGLLAYCDYPISTGPLEGTNNKIKTLKRQAYGFRDLEFFKLKILAIHEAKYALVG